MHKSVTQGYPVSFIQVHTVDKNRMPLCSHTLIGNRFCLHKLAHVDPRFVWLTGQCLGLNVMYKVIATHKIFFGARFGTSLSASASPKMEG